MKKTLLMMSLILGASWLCAEEVHFVTLLSQPVGTFSKVELLDATRAAEIFHLNFCNNTSTSGTINVGTGATGDYLVNVDALLGGTAGTLKSNVKGYDVLGSDSEEGLMLLQGGDLKGKSLNANVLSVQSTSVSKVKSNTFEASDDVRAGAASFDNYFEVDGTAYYGQGNVRGSNVYASNFDWEKVSCASSSSDDANDCNSYVLIGGRTTTEGGEDSDPSEEEPYECIYGDTYYDSASGMCVCSDENAVAFYNGVCCSYSRQWDSNCFYAEEDCSALDMSSNGEWQYFGYRTIQSCSWDGDGYCDGGFHCETCDSSTEGTYCTTQCSSGSCKEYECVLTEPDEECPIAYTPLWQTGTPNYYDPRDYQ